jgi:WD40 repeat protein
MSKTVLSIVLLVILLVLVVGVTLNPPVQASIVSNFSFSNDKAIPVKAQNSLAQQLVKDAKTILADDPELIHRSSLLAIESLRREISAEGEAILRDNLVLSAQPVAELHHNSDVTQLVFSADGQWLATAGKDDNLAYLWRYDEIGHNQATMLKHDAPLSAMLFSPGSQWLITGSADKMVRVWEVATGQLLAEITLQDAVEALSFSSNGQWLATSNGTRVQVWAIGSGSPGDIFANREILYLPHQQKIKQVVFSPDSRWLATHNGTKVRVWEMNTQQEMEQISHANDVSRFTFSPNSQWLATNSWDKTTQLWQLHPTSTTRQGVIRKVANLTHEDIVWTATFSPDSRWLVTGSGEQATIWALNPTPAAGLMVVVEEKAKLLHHDWVSKLTFSSDGQWIASASWDKTARVWDATDGREVARLPHASTVLGVTFHPTTNQLATCSGEIVQIWQPALPTLPPVILSPNGRWGVSNDIDETFRVWETVSGREVIHFEKGHNIQQMAFSPDSRWLATLKIDNTTQIWNVATGQKSAQIHNSDRSVFNQVMSRSTVLGWDKTTQLAQWDVEQLITGACSWLPRNITPDEWTQYLGDEPYRATCH